MVAAVAAAVAVVGLVVALRCGARCARSWFRRLRIRTRIRPYGISWFSAGTIIRQHSSPAEPTRQFFPTGGGESSGGISRSCQGPHPMAHELQSATGVQLCQHSRWIRSAAPGGTLQGGSFPGTSAGSGNEWFLSVNFGRVSHPSKADSGARVNIMSTPHLRKLGYSSRDLLPADTHLISFSKNPVTPLGCLHIPILINKRRLFTKFFVVPTCANILIIGLPDLICAAVISFPGQKWSVEPVTKYSVAVDEFSFYKGEEVHLHLDPVAIPKHFPVRVIPLAYKHEVRRRLEEMVRNGIIAPVTVPTDWCH